MSCVCTLYVDTHW
uniref:Uncharacterized protein n=1 Tax=Anguilla anguilla TaxID=7936 RepID=A0A0E9UZY0_ANGAN